jgi:hypothetical protein
MKLETTRTKFQTPHERAKTVPPAEKAKTKKAVTKKATGKKVVRPEAKPRFGKLGELLGYSVISVIRAMGKAGWDFDTARAALDKAGVEAAKHTLKVGLKRGRDGQKFIAPLSNKQLDSLRAAVTIKKSK